jgi:NDP-sugar pyrophosphorylase family protein
MKAVLLAAGRGERLRPRTDTIPKCMLEVQGKPILQHWIERLRSDGVTELFINLHHLPEKVREYFGTGKDWGVQITYCEEKLLLGTAGGIKSFEGLLRGERFIVIYADNLSDCSLKSIYDFHVSRHAFATISLCWLDDPTSCGIAKINDEGYITRYREKPEKHEIFSNLINAGIYVFEPMVLSYIEPGVNSDISLHVLPKLIEDERRLYGYDYSGYILKFDRPSDWKRSLAFLAERSRSAST